jgi:hypothetical protein
MRGELVAISVGWFTWMSLGVQALAANNKPTRQIRDSQRLLLWRAMRATGVHNKHMIDGLLIAPHFPVGEESSWNVRVALALRPARAEHYNEFKYNEYQIEAQEFVEEASLTRHLLG